MLGFIFGFNARIGRMHYLLGTIALTVVMTALCFAIAGYAYQGAATETLTSVSRLTWPAMTLAGLFAWMTFTLQSMRIRDIGWDPVCVVSAWIALVIVDNLVAGKVPAWSLGQDQHGTIVGSTVNLILMLILMFWPGGDFESPTLVETRTKPDMPSSRSDAGSVTVASIARTTKTGFGTRGLR